MTECLGTRGATITSRISLMESLQNVLFLNVVIGAGVYIYTLNKTVHILSTKINTKL